jgi:hypothetical protein
MRTVREVLAEAAGGYNVLSRYAALTEAISDEVATEVASQWSGGAYIRKIDGVNALSGAFAVFRKEQREDLKVTWETEAAKFNVRMQIAFNGPGKKWVAAADIEGREATPQGMATHILATMEARGVRVGGE